MPHSWAVRPARLWNDAPGLVRAHGNDTLGTSGQAAGGSDVAAKKPTKAPTTESENTGKFFKSVHFGLPGSERDVLTAAVAKKRFLLRKEDLEGLSPYHSPLDAENDVLGNEPGYLVQDLERACLRRWGSEKEFRREQLRREIRRRREQLRKTQAGHSITDIVSSQMPFMRLDKVNAIINADVDQFRHKRKDAAPQGFSDLPWDPALGSLPQVISPGEVGTRAVHTAIATNFVVLLSKLVAFVYTGSASILSEAIHSIADLGNQCLLAVGIVQSQREADALHPYGYATERYVWSLISGVGIFFLGCGVSIYHGVQGLIVPHEIEHYQIGLAVLGLAFLVEGYSLGVALEECRIEAKKAKQSLREYIFEGSDATNVAVLMEDGVAVVGCGIAACCLYASQVTGNPIYDSMGSITIGSLLGVVAMVLIQKNRDLLVGSALPERRVTRVIAMLEQDAAVWSVHDVKAIIIGADRGRFKAEINFDAEVLAKRCMDKCRLELAALKGEQSEEQIEAFMLRYSKEFVAVLGDEVDRLEGMIRKELPEIRHVDLEIL